MSSNSRPALLLAAAVLLALAAWFIQMGKEVQAQPLRQPLARLDFSLAGWRAAGADQILDPRSLELLKPQDYLLRNYLDPRGRPCAVFVAYFGMQQEGQMIHSPRHCLPGSGWQIQSRHEVAVPGPEGGYRVNRLVLALGLERLSVLYWYQGRGRVEPNEYLDRLRLVTDGLFSQRSDGALVRLTSMLPGDDPTVLAGQVELAAALIPALERLLPPAAGQTRP